MTETSHVIPSNLFTCADLEWIAQKPGIPEKELQGAVDAFQQGNFEKAASSFSALAKRHQEKEWFSRCRLLCQLASGNDDAAKALEGDSTPFAEYVRGMLHESDSDCARAMECYSAALEADKEFFPAAFRLAYLKDLRNLEEEALQLYAACVQKEPRYMNLWMNLGGLHEDFGENEKALECYQKALALDPTNQRAAMFVADAQASLSMYVDDEKERENNKMAQILATPISDFELSVRSRNCLNKMKIKTLGDLIEKSEQELLSYKNFGETSLAEIKEILAKKGLKLGMGIEEKNVAKKKEKRERKPQASATLDTMDIAVSTMELSVRSRKCLNYLNVKTVGDLVGKKETELLMCKNFGVTSLQEIKKKLGELGLSLRSS